MADAPEKIGRFDYGRGDVRYTSPPLFISGQTNYIRADLVDDLRKALEEATGALEDVQSATSYAFDGDYTPESEQLIPRLRATLARIDALKEK